jgi:hypothetical protein
MPRPPRERRKVRRRERQLRLFVRVPKLVQLQVLEPARLQGPPLFLRLVPETAQKRALLQIQLQVPASVRPQVLPQVLRLVPEPVQRRALLQIRLQVPALVRLPALRQVLLRGPERGPAQRRERERLAQVEREPQPAPTARRLRAFQPTWELRPSSLRHRTRQA